MKKLNCFITLALAILLFSQPAFSLIESRIRGVVIDKGTGKPIKGASVTLFLRHQMDTSYMQEKIASIFSDANGAFSFEVPWPGMYFVKCKKDTYLSFLPDYYYKYVKKDYLSKLARVFKLDEGEIKHIKIQLEKGGILRGFFRKNEDDKIAPIKISAWILKESKKDERFVLDDYYEIEYIYSDENGYFEANSLEAADDYYLYIDLGDGYPRKFIKNINVAKNEVTDISRVYDLSNMSSIEGVVTLNSNPPSNGNIQIESMFEGDDGETVFSSYELGESGGNYFFKGLLPGQYRMSVSCFGPGGAALKKEFIIEIAEGTLKNFNISDN